MKRTLFLVILTISLVACGPQLNTLNQVAVLNGPAEYAVTGLADSFDSELKKLNTASLYQHVASSRLRFAEDHRDLFGSRANGSASLIARNVGAEFAVLVYAPEFERSVEDYQVNDLLKRKVITSLQLEARIIDPTTQEILASYQSSRYLSVRI